MGAGKEKSDSSLACSNGNSWIFVKTKLSSKDSFREAPGNASSTPSVSEIGKLKRGH